MIALIQFVLAVLASSFKSKSRLEAENAALRQQLIADRDTKDQNRTASACGHALTNSFDDFSRSVAAFTRLVGRLARFLVHLLAGSVALRADIFAGAGRSCLWVIVGGVVPKWIFGLHGLTPFCLKK
jgi:hypothetical protein